MPRHQQNLPNSDAYLRYGRFLMSEAEFNLRAYGKRTLGTKVPDTSLTKQRIHIVERLRMIMVGGYPISLVAEASGVKRQALYLNIHKFLMMSDAAIKTGPFKLRPKKTLPPMLADKTQPARAK